MKHIFWDFNGTVLDDVKITYNVLIKMLKEENRPLVSFEDYLNIFEFPIINYYEKVYDLTVSDFYDLANRFINYYMADSVNAPLHNDIIEVIEIFKNKGYKNYLLSASKQSNLEKQIDDLNIRNLFDAILGINDIYATSKVGVGLKFMKESNINPKDALMIGDTLHDKEVADAMGIDIIIFTKGHQHKDRLKHLANIDSFRDLIDKI